MVNLKANFIFRRKYKLKMSNARSLDGGFDG